MHSGELTVEVLHQRTFLARAGDDLLALQLYGVVGFHLVAQSAIFLCDKQGRQQLVFLRLIAQIIADGLHQIDLALQFHVSLRDVLGTVGIGLRHHLDIGYQRLALIVGHTIVEAFQFVLQRGEALSHITL